MKEYLRFWVELGRWNCDLIVDVLILILEFRWMIGRKRMEEHLRKLYSKIRLELIWCPEQLNSSQKESFRKDGKKHESLEPVKESCTVRMDERVSFE